mgnify:CR=1 FL=1
MPILHVPSESKAQYRDLLLLADEDWTMVMRYLTEASVYVLVEDGDNTPRALIALVATDSNTMFIPLFSDKATVGVCLTLL